MSLSTVKKTFYSAVTKAAEDHAMCSAAGHEVCDLQNVIEELLEYMPDETVSSILRKADGVSRDIINDWLDIDMIVANIDEELAKETIVQIAFDICEASVSHEVKILNPEYDEDRIISELSSGVLATTTWHGTNEIPYISVIETNENIAEIVSQEVDGVYVDYQILRGKHLRHA